MRNGDNTDADYDDTDYENDENDDTDDADTDDVDVQAMLSAMKDEIYLTPSTSAASTSTSKAKDTVSLLISPLLYAPAP